MPPAALGHGLRLACVIKKLKGVFLVGAYPTDVYDGRNGGIGQRTTFFWHIDKASLHIHHTIEMAVRRDYDEVKLSSNAAQVDEAASTLFERVNSRHFRHILAGNLHHRILWASSCQS